MPKIEKGIDAIPDFAELRKMAGISQEEVAWSVGTDQSQLSKIERKVIVPSACMIKKLLEFYMQEGINPFSK